MLLLAVGERHADGGAGQQLQHRGIAKLRRVHVRDRAAPACEWDHGRIVAQRIQVNAFPSKLAVPETPGNTSTLIDEPEIICTTITPNWTPTSNCDISL